MEDLNQFDAQAKFAIDNLAREAETLSSTLGTPNVVVDIIIRPRTNRESIEASVCPEGTSPTTVETTGIDGNRVTVTVCQ